MPTTDLAAILNDFLGRALMPPNAQLSGGCRRSKAEPEAVRCSVWFGGC